jgi:hypothetical protein
MLTMYTRGVVGMGSRAQRSGVWMDGDTDVMRRHEERVARSLAVLGARARDRRRGWAARGLLGWRSGLLFSRRTAVLR